MIVEGEICLQNPVTILPSWIYWLHNPNYYLMRTHLRMKCVSIVTIPSRYINLQDS